MLDLRILETLIEFLRDELLDRETDLIVQLIPMLVMLVFLKVVGHVKYGKALLLPSGICADLGLGLDRADVCQRLRAHIQYFILLHNNV